MAHASKLSRASKLLAAVIVTVTVATTGAKIPVPAAETEAWFENDEVQAEIEAAGTDPWIDLPYESEPIEDEDLQREQAGYSDRSAAVCRNVGRFNIELCGAILEKWDSLGAIKWIGDPIGPMTLNPDGVGYRAEFDLGSIYWSPASGAWTVTKPAMEAWGRTHWEAGNLGYPVSDAFAVAPNVGVKQIFQHGNLYGSAQGVHSVYGNILKKYNEYRAEQGKLGFPLTDETGVPDGRGRFNRFQLGMIYWSPESDAHPIFDGVLDEWSRSGYEAGTYGYPANDPHPSGLMEQTQSFTHGELTGLLLPFSPVIFDTEHDDIPEGEYSVEKDFERSGDRSFWVPVGECKGSVGRPHISGDNFKKGRSEVHAKAMVWCDRRDAESAVFTVLKKSRPFRFGEVLTDIGRSPNPAKKVGATKSSPTKRVAVAKCEDPKPRRDTVLVFGTSRLPDQETVNLGHLVVRSRSALKLDCINPTDEMFRG